MFRDRREAGRALAARLGHIDPAGSVVLALPRGGVPVAAEVSAATGAPLELMLVRKVGLPGHVELAVGAIAEGPGLPLVVNQDVAAMTGLSRARIEALAQEEQKELERRRRVYRGARDRLPLAERTVILVDDGIATGATMRAAIRAARAEGAARIVVAVPVAPSDTVASLRGEADEVVCLETPFPFYSVGQHYEEFDQVSDDDVIAQLNSARPPPRRAEPQPTGGQHS